MLSVTEKKNGFDLTLTAPPSVSIAADMGGRSAQEILAAHRAAVGEIVAEIQAGIGAFPFEAVIHTEDRIEKPNLHTHLLTASPEAFSFASKRTRELGRDFRRFLARHLQEKDFSVSIYDKEDVRFDLIPF